ncbi:hypothetical protein PspLS_00266 [Pyricularia sp. CBS 133598]|nr:hypothetical protein PspLS_00266 [Pyricularia sp. CBS 133598]
MSQNYENAKAQAATASAMSKATVGLLKQVLEESKLLSETKQKICQVIQVAELTNALTAAITRAVHHHQHAEGMAFAIANECVAEVKEQVHEALRAAVEAAPEVVVEEGAEDESLDLLGAVLEDVFSDEALNLVEKKD